MAPDAQEFLSHATWMGAFAWMLRGRIRERETWGSTVRDGELDRANAERGARESAGGTGGTGYVRARSLEAGSGGEPNR